MDNEKRTINKYKAIVMGVSAGGWVALPKVLAKMPEDFPLPIIVVQHLHPEQDGFTIKHFNDQCALLVKEACDKETIQTGTIYFAPPDYHLLIEQDKTFSLSKDEKVNYARPSIDVLFDSAADVYSSGLIGVVLTGANSDGANGLKLIKESGGLAIVQDPATAESPVMPQAAVDAAKPDYILPLEEIATVLRKMATTR